MNPPLSRLVRGERPPNLRSLALWLGGEAHGRWEDLVRSIHASYPGVFRERWVWGGEREGWRLRFFRSHAFCCLVPERGRFLVRVVLQPHEQEKVEAIWGELGPQARADYRAAAVRAEGRRLLLEVTDEATLQDAQRVLAAKRVPKVARG